MIIFFTLLKRMEMLCITALTLKKNYLVFNLAQIYNALPDIVLLQCSLYNPVVQYSVLSSNPAPIIRQLFVSRQACGAFPHCTYKKYGIILFLFLFIDLHTSQYHQFLLSVITLTIQYLFCSVQRQYTIVQQY